jgi:mannitol-specific phosphotransferase system IIBC component
MKASGPSMKPQRGSYIKAAAIPAVVLTVVASFCVPFALSQSTAEQRPDLQQLQLKLQQMEQQMQELKQQIGALQQNQKPQPAPQATPTKDNNRAT